LLDIFKHVIVYLADFIKRVVDDDTETTKKSEETQG
jgi:hypothetical protein